MIKKQIQALAAGICIAVIVQESIWVAFNLLDPTQSLNRALADAPLSNGWLVPLLLAWLVGGFFGGLMATLVGNSRFSGHLSGLLLSGSAVALAWLSMPDAGGFLSIAATPSIGAALGAWLGFELTTDQDQPPIPASIVTLHAGFH